MSKKCKVCEEEIHRGTGTLMYGSLVHRKGCKEMIKRYPWKFKRKGVK